MTDPRSIGEAVQRAWAAADERSSRALAAAQRQFADAQRAIKERAERQTREWTQSAQALGRKPDLEVEEIDIRSEEEHERHEGHEDLLDRTVRRNRATADAAEAGEDLLMDAFRVVPKAPEPEPESAPEPEVASYLPRSMRDRARRRAEDQT